MHRPVPCIERGVGRSVIVRRPALMFGELGGDSSPSPEQLGRLAGDDPHLDKVARAIARSRFDGPASRET
jgi:hypothetical protein